MQDPIANMLTRIRNGQSAHHTQVSLPSSILKEQLVRVMQEEGYITGYSVEALENNKKRLTIDLKYHNGRPVIERIKKISRPGCRVYRAVKELMPIPGFGIAILSTPSGIMTHVAAKKNGVGGEVICEIA
jgi:small subunit ribosomal protein S8